VLGVLAIAIHVTLKDYLIKRARAYDFTVFRRSKSKKSEEKLG
jgi:hypothetical protein